MKYSSLIDKLKHVDFDCCYPLFVPSILRPAYHTYKNIVSYLPKSFRMNKVFYVVRKEWYKVYKQSQPDVRIEVIPESYEYDGYGLDTTRKFIADFAESEGYKRIFDWDDDLTMLNVVYGSGNNTRLLRKEERTKYCFNILTFCSQTADDVFNDYEDAVFGSLSRQTPSTVGKDYHLDKYWINKGNIPRQTNILDIERIRKFGIVRDGAFDKHMEDQGFAFKCVLNNAKLFKLPFAVVNIPPFDDNVGTEEQLFGDRMGLWADGISKLKDLGVEEYIAYTSKNKEQHGDHQPHGINWRKWNKDHGTESIVVKW